MPEDERERERGEEQDLRDLRKTLEHCVKSACALCRWDIGRFV